MKKLGQSHCKNRKGKIFAAQKEILRLLQLEDDLLNIDFSQARYIPTSKKQ